LQHARAVTAWYEHGTNKRVIYYVRMVPRHGGRGARRDWRQRAAAGSAMDDKVTD
jgi:hypothetical protein